MSASDLVRSLLSPSTTIAPDDLFPLVPSVAPPVVVPPEYVDTADGNRQDDNNGQPNDGQPNNGAMETTKLIASTRQSSSSSASSALSSVQALIEAELEGASGERVVEKALRLFVHIDANEYRGSAQGLAVTDDNMPCQCQYGPGDPQSDACGDHCVNRALFIECNPAQCPVGEHCQNQRFRKQAYCLAKVIASTGKGCGLVAVEDTPPNTFVREYVGEVVSLSTFAKRTRQYASEGYRHHYCMSLSKDEMIDATKRGGIARFINHSCNPNCAVQKWIVGNRFRMGIFTTRLVRAGEEFTFDYKFERYNEKPQKCLCGEPNCKGTIGIRKENGARVENDADLSDESSDEEVVEEKGSKIKGLEQPEQVPNFVKAMLRSSGKPKRVHKLTVKIIATDSQACHRRFVQLHGMLILKQWLREHKDDVALLKRILFAIQRIPVATKNTINDAMLEPMIQEFTKHNDATIMITATSILEEWSKLKLVYRIPKAAPKPVDTTASEERKPDEQSENGNKRSLEKSTSEEYDSDRSKRPKADYRDSRYSNDSQQSSYNNYHSSRSGPRDQDHHDRFDHNRSSNRGSGPVYIDLRGRRDDYSRRPPPYHDTSTYNRGMRDREWEDDRLPANWERFQDDKGNVYYFNRHTRKTQWERPYDESPSSNPAPPPSLLPPTSSSQSDDPAQVSSSGANGSGGLNSVPVDKKPGVSGHSHIEGISQDAIEKVIARAQQQKMEKERQEREEMQKIREERKKKKKEEKRGDKKKRDGKDEKEAKEKSKTGGVDSASSSRKSSAESDKSKEVVLEAKKEMRDAFAALVTKYFSRYKGDFEGEVFKTHARKMTHVVIEKETRDKKNVTMTDETKRKVKKFVESYVEKLKKTLAE